MSYHQDDGKKPVYHGGSGFCLLRLMAILAIVIASIFAVATAPSAQADQACYSPCTQFVNMDRFGQNVGIGARINRSEPQQYDFIVAPHLWSDQYAGGRYVDGYTIGSGFCVEQLTDYYNDGSFTDPITYRGPRNVTFATVWHYGLSAYRC